MRYIVDGYNVTFADPATSGLAVEEQREALVRRLAARGAELLGPGRITVVFDGAEDVHGGRDTRIEVLYARGEAADELIVRLATGSDGAVVVVTSDRELGERVRAALSDRAEIRPRERLFESARAPGRKKGRFSASTAGLPKGANRITEELKRIWLDGEE